MMTQPLLQRSVHRRRSLGCLMVLATSLLLSSALFAQSGERVRIAAAASLRDVLPEIIANYHTNTKNMADVQISYASSGNLSRQVQQGAPYDLFLSANLDSVNRLPQSSTHPLGTYALGHLALVMRERSAIEAGLTDENWNTALSRLQHSHNALGKTLSLAIANPNHAPYGLAAEQALRHIGWYERLSKTQRQAENASQVLQIVLAGGASVGLVPQSLLKSTAVKQHNLWSQAVDVSHHERIQHTMILLAPDNRSASELFSFFLSGDNRALWQKYGFSTP